MAHKWNSPREWLDDKLVADELTEREVLSAIIDLVDNDTLQDVFQAEMDADGYFDSEDA